MDSPYPSVEARELLADERWPAFRDSLEERKTLLEGRLLNPTLDYPAMCRLAGEIRGLRYALGIPAELLKADPRSST